MLLIHFRIHYQLVSSYSDGETIYEDNVCCKSNYFLGMKLVSNTYQPTEVDDMVDRSHTLGTFYILLVL